MIYDVSTPTTTTTKKTISKRRLPSLKPLKVKAAAHAAMAAEEADKAQAEAKAAEGSDEANANESQLAELAVTGKQRKKGGYIKETKHGRYQVRAYVNGKEKHFGNVATYAEAEVLRKKAAAEQAAAAAKPIPPKPGPSWRPPSSAWGASPWI